MPVYPEHRAGGAGVGDPSRANALLLTPGRRARTLERRIYCAPSRLRLNAAHADVADAQSQGQKLLLTRDEADIVHAAWHDRTLPLLGVRGSRQVLADVARATSAADAGTPASRNAGVVRHRPLAGPHGTDGTFRLGRLGPESGRGAPQSSHLTRSRTVRR